MFEKIKGNKFAMKVTSVLLAVILWLILIYSVNPVISQQVKNVPVTIIGESELTVKGLALINKKEIGTASVKIRGERTSVIKSLSVISASVDISNINGTGEWTEYVSFDTGVAGVAVDGRNNTTVKVEVDELVRKKIPVRVQQVGSVKDKQTIIGSVPEASEMTVRGAKSELAELKEAVVTVDISGIGQDTEVECGYYFVNNDDTKQEFASIIDLPSTIKVQNTLYERRTVSLAVRPKVENDRIKLDVKSMAKDKIDIGVPRGTVLEIETLPLIFDTNDYSDDVGEYILTVEAGDGIYIPPESRNIAVKLSMEQMTLSDVRVPVEARNVPAGLKARLTNDTVTISVAAPSGTDLSAGIKAYIDLAGKTAGRYEMPVSADAGENIILLENAHIGVTLS